MKKIVVEIVNHSTGEVEKTFSSIMIGKILNYIESELVHLPDECGIAISKQEPDA